MSDLEREIGLALLRDMLRIRRLEEKSAELYSAEKIRGFLHLYIGEEAVAVGVMRELRPEDAVVATYREHGHALARGVSARSIMAEMYGKVTGCSRGRGGSMHLFDAATRFYGGNAIVGGGLPLAVGLGLADSMLRRPRVTACFFGEGAMAEGEFHEAMNLAELWRLPVVFCCENNLYAMGTALGRSESEVDLVRKAESYRVPGEAVDGMDVLAVSDAARRAIDRARRGEGPSFLELRTYRFRPHSMFDPELYRTKAEVERWRARDPILLLERRLVERGWLSSDDRSRLEQEVAAEVADAVAFAETSPLEPVADLARFVMAEAPRPSPARPAQGADDPARAESRPGTAVALQRRGAGEGARARQLTYREATREALREALGRDERVFLVGEDVGRYGGCFGVSKGLQEEFGEERVRDAPLSEAGFTGAGIGAALGGLRPIVEIMTVNFSLLALDQLVNTAAALRHMSGNQFGVPLVVRMATGAGRQLAAQHSHSLEGWYAHVPGIRVLAPATLEDARGMLWQALQEPDPVVIFEHAALYNLKGELPEDAGPVDISRAVIRRAGTDVTLITWGGCLGKTLQAAEQLAAEGTSAEVIDLRVLRPLDEETLLASVRRTHRAVVVDEEWRSGSLSAEIAARLAELAFHDLDAPVERVCSAEVPIPYARHLEEAALPQPEGIAAAARRTRQ